MYRDSSHSRSNHPTSTAAPISTTRQPGRPRPPEIRSDIGAALVCDRRGSRSRATSDTATISSDALSMAATYTSDWPLCGGCGRSARSTPGRYPRSEAAIAINSTITATTRPVALSKIGIPLDKYPSWHVVEANGQRLEPLDELREPVQRRLQHGGGGAPRLIQALLVGQPRPVVGVGDPGPGLTQRLELPAPQMPGRRLARRRRLPGDPATLVEFDDAIVANAAVAQGHREDVPYRPDPLSLFGLREVVVAVPARLLGRIGDQLEDPVRGGGDLAACADYSRCVVVHRPRR